MAEFLTAQLQGTAGIIRQQPEDFRVEEIPHPQRRQVVVQLAGDLDLHARTHRRQLFAARADHFAGKELEDLPGTHRFADAFGQRLALFARQQVLTTEHFDIHYYPELLEAARLTGQMAERSYARLSRILNHSFKERKPIIIFGSRAEFAQNNVLGDLGEGTGGVTDALRQRNMFFFAGDLGEAEHVLTHEMVHVFQYDIFARGRAGSGMQQLAQVNRFW